MVFFYYFIIIVTMFAVSALIPHISSGDKTSLTAFERLLALDLAIIILGCIFFYLRRSTEEVTEPLWRILKYWA
jgi:hypothetical protein